MGNPDDMRLSDLSEPTGREERRILAEIDDQELILAQSETLQTYVKRRV